MDPKLSSRQTRTIREWAEAYRLWNAKEWARRRAQAGRESMEEKLRAFNVDTRRTCSDCLYCRVTRGHG